MIRSRARVLTILRPYTSKDDVALLVDLDSLNSILPPLSQQDNNLLAGSSTRNGHAKMRSSGLDTEEARKPILLDLNIATFARARLVPLSLWSSGTAKRLANNRRIRGR